MPGIDAGEEGGAATSDHIRRGGLEMGLIAYFHHLTALILKTLADVVDAAEDDLEGLEVGEVEGHAPTPSTPPRSPPIAAATPALGSEDEPSQQSKDRKNDSAPLLTPPAIPPQEQEEQRGPDVVVEAEDMTRMGLDPRSDADRAFVRGLVELYWGRGCTVSRAGVDICGVRLC